MKIEVLNVEYKPSGIVDLSDSVFGIEPRSDILSRVVRWQLAKRRAGTHSTKTISDVSGSGKKIVRQKGTGGARHGSKRGTQFRGGGVVLGPLPRSHAFSLPKKIRRLGLRMAVADKIKSGEFLILENFEFSCEKTKDFWKMCKNQGFSSALFVDEFISSDFGMVVNNSVGYDALPQIGLNVYDILLKERLVMTKTALKTLEARLKNE